MFDIKIILFLQICTELVLKPIQSSNEKAIGEAASIIILFIEEVTLGAQRNVYGIVSRKRLC
jgi:hypothetical protein